MDPSALQDFYRSAHFVMIGPGHFVGAKAIQLFTEWKQLRKKKLRKWC
jgi:hypothetical protein